MKRFAFCLAVLCVLGLLSVQNGYARGAVWEKYFGGENEEGANDICRVSASETSDYVVVGYKWNAEIDRHSAYILRVGYNGNLISETTYGGPQGNQDCMAHSVAIYNDRNYGTCIVVTGLINNNNQWDIFAVSYKLSTFKKIRENACVGGSGFKAAYKIILFTPQGDSQGFAMTGETDDSKMCVLHLEQDLRFSYSSTLDQADYAASAGYSLVQDPDDQVLYVCGKAVMLYSGDTQVLWTRYQSSFRNFVNIGHIEFGGANTDIGYSISLAGSHGETVIAGRYGQSAFDSNYLLVFVDRYGYATSASWGTGSNEELTSVVQTESSLIVAGRKNVGSKGYIRYAVYLAKLRKSDRYVEWEKYFDESTQNKGTSSIKTTEATGSSYIGIATSAFPGHNNGDAYVIKYGW